MRRHAAALFLAAAPLLAAPLRLHPSNPRYFEFRGKPAVLITSGEHYGAVINGDFNYVAYLDELHARHLNLTRTWAGAYREAPGNFGIVGNTLAPRPEAFIAPWARSSQPGAADGLNKFDLTKWNPAYFARLKDFLAAASVRGIVVELNLFCPYYEDGMWEISPLNARNNVNGIGDVPHTEALTMKHPDLVAIEDAMVRRIIAELRDFDNVYYEICNEPYFGGVTLDWQQHIAGVIASEERRRGLQHLISQNIANGSQRVENPLAAVSILNFHYSRPPDSVAMNFDLRRAVGNNETGFDGGADAAYRIQGWDFLVAGGALYNNLDYSFTVGHERGDFAVPSGVPGGGSRQLRTQLGFLHDTLDSLPFLHMAPDAEVLASSLPDGASARVLAQPGKAYLVYIHYGRVVKEGKPPYRVDASPRRISLALDVPPGVWRCRWLNPKMSRVEREFTARRAGGALKLETPEHSEDIALVMLANRQ
jgi:hypothetical protein